MLTNNPDNLLFPADVDYQLKVGVGVGVRISKALWLCGVEI